MIIFWILTLFVGSSAFVRLSIRRRATTHGEIGGYHKSLPTEEEWMEFRSQMAANFREQLISVAGITQGAHAQVTWVGAVVSNPRGRRVVAQLLGSVHQAPVIDVGDSVGPRAAVESDPYPEELVAVPDRRDGMVAVSGSA